MQRVVWIIVLVGAVAGSAPQAWAARAVPCQRVPDGTISVDGLRSDWRGVSSQRLAGGHALNGDKSRWQGPPDLLGKLRCAHDGKGTYLLLEVNDDQVVRTARFTTSEDRVELLFRGARGKVRTLQIHPPNARFRRGRVRWTTRPYGTRRLVHRVIRLRHGYAVELKIGDGGVPGYGLGSPRLAMTLRIVDHDGGPTSKADTILVTGGDGASSLGRIEYDTGKTVFSKFLRDKGL